MPEEQSVEAQMLRMFAWPEEVERQKESIPVAPLDGDSYEESEVFLTASPIPCKLL